MLICAALVLMMTAPELARFYGGMVIDATIGLRVPAEDEAKGLDLSQHAELAYAGTREYRTLETAGVPNGSHPTSGSTSGPGASIHPPRG